MEKQPEDFKHVYTVGELLDYIEKHKIPREGKILMQRVEDSYYEGSDISGITGKLPDGSYGALPPGSKAKPWSVVKRPDYMHFMTIDKIKEIEANPKDFPKITSEILENMKKSVDEGYFMSQYTPVHSPVLHDDGKHLYLDAHY